MNLADHQRGVRSLLCGRAVETTDAYLDGVAGTEAVALVQEIASSWRNFALGRTCPLTIGALRLHGSLEATLAAHHRKGGHSPFLEVLAQQFLAVVAAHDDALVAAIAQFERSAHRARTGAASPDDEVVIDWPCDPWEALQAVLDNQPLPPPTRHCRTRAAATTPDQFTIARVARPAAR
jgi:hypothetical protein